MSYMYHVGRYEHVLSIDVLGSDFDSSPLPQMLPKFEIGTLLTREFVPYKSDESGFYRDMCQRVGKVWAEKKHGSSR